MPHYYSTLRPFRELFLSGWPVLTYHHVGPRTRGARLKGLYVSPKLFARQLDELVQAGFQCGNLGELAERRKPSAPRAFVTFDDGFCDVWRHALPLLRERRLCATLYLVPNLLGKSNEWQQRAGDVVEPLMDAAQVRDWLAAGQAIGSHTLTHPRLTQLSVAAAREEISASKKALEDQFGLPVEHFCYPYGDWNPGVRDLVQAAGYKTACTTLTGLNTAQTSPFELQRFTARYPSRNLKALWARLWAFTSGG